VEEAQSSWRRVALHLVGRFDGPNWLAAGTSWERDNEQDGYEFYIPEKVIFVSITDGPCGYVVTKGCRRHGVRFFPFPGVVHSSARIGKHRT